MPLTFYRTLQLALLGLAAGACQRPAYQFSAPAVPVIRAAPALVRPDSAATVLRVAPQQTPAKQLAHPRSRVVRPRSAPSLSAHFRPVTPIRMAQPKNLRARNIQKVDAARKRPLLTENQLLALALLGGGAVLTVVGLLLVFAVGGGLAITAGILLGLLGLGLVGSWFYIRALGRAFQH